MASLTLPDLPDAVRDALQAQAKRHGRTLEAEAVAVLEAATGAASARPLPQPTRSPRPGPFLSDLLVADRRLKTALETGLIDRDQFVAWGEAFERGDLDLKTLSARLERADREQGPA
ncbi:MAG: hypothetical protein ACFB2Z_08040 [Maricaulaceae bacterium]